MVALFVAAENGTRTIILELVASGADVNQSFPTGLTALHGAAHRGQSEMIRFLTSMGAHVDPVDQSGTTPLVLAIRSRHNDTIIALLEAGASADTARTHLDGQDDQDFFMRIQARWLVEKSSIPHIV